MLFEILVATLRGIKDDQASFEGLPKIFWDESCWNQAFFEELIRFHWSAIKYVPPGLITANALEAAVNQSPEALECIPMYLRTMALCRAATSFDIRAISFVPDEYQHTLIDEWWNKFDGSPDYILELPQVARSQEMYMRAVEKNPLSIAHVPTHLHTDEMCAAFLSNGCDCLEDVPYDFRSKQLCVACLRVGRGPYEAVPRHIRDIVTLNADKLGRQLDE